MDKLSLNNICPFCEQGTLSPNVGTESVRHNGKMLEVEGFQFSLCNKCGEEMVRPEQARENEVLIADAKHQLDGTLSTADLKCFRLRHGLTQGEAAQLFGGGQNAFSKYERGEVLQARSMDLLIRVFDTFPEVQRYLRQRSGLSPESVWRTTKPAAPSHPTVSGPWMNKRLNIVEQGWHDAPQQAAANG